MRRTNALTCSAVAAALAVPGGVAAQQNQQPQAAGQADAQGQGQEVAQQCLQDVRQFNQELMDAGYGGAPVATTPAAGYGTGTVDDVPPMAPGGYGVLGTARGGMRAMMQSAYAFALNGDEETCQSVLSGMRDIYEQSGTTTAAGDVDAWREQMLAAAVPVTEVQDAVQMDQVLGADVRNANGEDLGDIDDVILDPQGGGIQYVLVSEGGFLGIGEDLVPVRWNDLQVATAMPYQDTFVLDVPEDAFENAPTVSADATEGLGEQTWNEVNQFWDENTQN